MCICVYLYTHTHTHKHIYIYIHIHTHTHINIYIYTYTHTHTQTYIYIYIHTHTHTHTLGAGIAQSVRRLATGWRVLGSNPGGGKIFRTRPDRPWGPCILLHNGYRVSVPGVKRPGRGVDHPTPSSARVKESVEVYLCFPSGPSWPVLE